MTSPPSSSPSQLTRKKKKGEHFILPLARERNRRDDHDDDTLQPQPKIVRRPVRQFDSPPIVFFVLDKILLMQWLPQRTCGPGRDG